MKENTNIDTNSSEVIYATITAQEQVGHDLRNAMLIVSVLVNLFVLTTWIALQLTSVYDASLAQALLGR